MKQLRTKALLLALPFILAFAVFYIIPYGTASITKMISGRQPVGITLKKHASILLKNMLKCLKN